MDIDLLPIHAFFDRYERHFNDVLAGEEPDMDYITGAFAECFVESSPAGVICGKNDQEFRERMPKGFDFYRKIGTKSMRILSRIPEVLDDMHTLVKIHWRSTNVKDETVIEIDFYVYYFLREEAGSLKIFAYITGDEQKVLKEHGLI